MDTDGETNARRATPQELEQLQPLPHRKSPFCAHCRTRGMYVRTARCGDMLLVCTLCSREWWFEPEGLYEQALHALRS